MLKKDIEVNKNEMLGACGSTRNYNGRLKKFNSSKLHFTDDKSNTNSYHSEQKTICHSSENVPNKSKMLALYPKEVGGSNNNSNYCKDMNFVPDKKNPKISNDFNCCDIERIKKCDIDVETPVIIPVSYTKDIDEGSKTCAVESEDNNNSSNDFSSDLSSEKLKFVTPMEFLEGRKYAKLHDMKANPIKTTSECVTKESDDKIFQHDSAKSFIYSQQHTRNNSSSHPEDPQVYFPNDVNNDKTSVKPDSDKKLSNNQCDQTSCLQKAKHANQTLKNLPQSINAREKVAKWIESSNFMTSNVENYEMTESVNKNNLCNVSLPYNHFMSNPKYTQHISQNNYDANNVKQINDIKTLADPNPHFIQPVNSIHHHFKDFTPKAELHNFPPVFNKIHSGTLPSPNGFTRPIDIGNLPPREIRQMQTILLPSIFFYQQQLQQENTQQDYSCMNSFSESNQTPSVSSFFNSGSPFAYSEMPPNVKPQVVPSVLPCISFPQDPVNFHPRSVATSENLNLPAPAINFTNFCTNRQLSSNFEGISLEDPPSFEISSNLPSSQQSNSQMPQPLINFPSSYPTLSEGLHIQAINYGHDKYPHALKSQLPQHFSIPESSNSVQQSNRLNDNIIGIPAPKHPYHK